MQEVPYPPNTRAKGWRFELDYERIEASSTWALAPAELRPWLLMLWLTAWRQRPCGSLESDESVIAARIGMPAAMWAANREVLLRGWAPATDGRLYHPTITELVLEMLSRRRSESDRKARQRAVVTPESANVPRDTNVTPKESDTDHRPIEEISDGAKAPSSSTSSTRRRRNPLTEIPPPYEQIVAVYREVLPELPGLDLDGKTWERRKKAIREFWNWVLTSVRSDGVRRAANAEEAMAWIRQYFERARSSDWVMGREARGNGHSNWEANLDYLLSEKGKVRVIERTR